MQGERLSKCQFVGPSKEKKKCKKERKSTARKEEIFQPTTSAKPGKPASTLTRAFLPRFYVDPPVNTARRIVEVSNSRSVASSLCPTRHRFRFHAPLSADFAKMCCCPI